MLSSPRYSRPLVTGMLLLVAAFVGWLLFSVAGDRSAMISLPGESGSTVAMLADPSGALNADDVAAKPDEAWTIWDGEGYLHPDDGAALWVRVTLRNVTDEAQRGVLGDTEYFSDRVELWERDPNAAGGWRRSVSGESVTAAEKPLWGRMSAFPVDVPARSERVFYFRWEDRFSVWARIGWWPRIGDYFSAQVRDAIAEAACYGALFGLLVYNTVFWVRLRDVATGYYVLYASTLTVANFLANGGPALLGWPIGSPGKEMFFIGALGGSAVFLVSFARLFLESEKRIPRADRLARGVRWLLLAFVAGALVLPWLQSSDGFRPIVPLVGASHALMLAMGVMAWRQGVYHARYFIVASAAMLAGALPAVVQWTGRDLSKSAASGVLAGSVLEITLLAFAVAGRFARLQREKMETQARLVEEMEQRRAMQEAYADELEVEVRERTRDLETANADKDRMIAVLGHDLRGPLTGLTQTAERLASSFDVAELKRYAGDASQTGRLLLLLIEDLVLWARLRAGTRHIARYAVTSWVSPAVAMHRSLAEQNGVEIAVNVAPEVHIDTDFVLAQALARNLVSNAVKYARTRVEVVVTAVVEGAQLIVRDDGPGLPQHVLAWLAENAPANNGDGGRLGLRFCTEIGRGLGARIQAANIAAGGTMFTVTFNEKNREAVT